jgi:hypothetical protein
MKLFVCFANIGIGVYRYVSKGKRRGNKTKEKKRRKKGGQYIYANIGIGVLSECHMLLHTTPGSSGERGGGGGRERRVFFGGG